MRVLVTGASGLIGSNLLAAAAQQSWTALGTFNEHPVQLRGAQTAHLNVGDRRACLQLADRFEPDVVIHAAASVALSRLECEPGLAELNLLGAEHTLAAARSVRASYVLVSSDWVFSGRRHAARCWEEHDPTEPLNAYGRSKLACEHAVQDFGGSWLITRPANVYGVNLALPTTRAASGRTPAAVAAALRLAHARHVWEHSSLALRWVSHLRGGRPLPAPAGVQQSPTYAWDYAQRVCDLIAQDCHGIFNTAGPDALSRHDFLRLLAHAFDCDAELVQSANVAAFLRACGEDPALVLPANTALCDAQASFALGRPALDPHAGLRLMREQLRRVLGARRGGAEHAGREASRSTPVTEESHT